MAVPQGERIGLGRGLSTGFWLRAVALAGIVTGMGVLAGIGIAYGFIVPLILLFVALIVFLIVLMGWPVLTVVLLAAAALLTRYKLEFGEFSMRAEHVAAVGVAFLGTWQLVRWRRRLVITTPGVFALGWLATNLAATMLNAPDPGDSQRHTFRLFLVVLNFFLAVNLLQKPRQWRQAYRWFLFLGVAEAAFGLFALAMFPLGLNLGVQTAINLPYPVPYGTFEEGNLFGSHSAAWLLALLFLYLGGEPPSERALLRRIVLSIGIGILGLAVLLSLSRGAWLGLLAGLLLVYIFHGHSRVGQMRRLTFVLIAGPVVISLLILALLFLPDSVPLIGRVRSFAALGRDATFQGRLDDLPRALNDWSQHPIIGWGPGTYLQLHGRLRGSPAWLPNIILRTIQETGAVGLVLFAGYVLALLVSTIGASRLVRGPDDRAMLLGLAVGYCALLVSYQATDGTWLAAPWLHTGLLMAGTRALSVRSTGSAEGAESGPPRTPSVET
ncbi:MAG: O-antigen ligase family protein [Anaerolineae bacterium]|nr:O-antigen ligase family protein [Anaerolineae bacterium]